MSNLALEALYQPVAEAIERFFAGRSGGFSAARQAQNRRFLAEQTDS